MKQMLLSQLKTLPTKWLIGGFVVGMLLVDMLIVRQRFAPHSIDAANLPTYTLVTIAKFDGTDPSQPILLAYHGQVYDVSAGREQFYGPGQSYHSLVGKDSSALLDIAGGDIIRRKYQVVGKLIP